MTEKRKIKGFDAIDLMGSVRELDDTQMDLFLIMFKNELKNRRNRQASVVKHSMAEGQRVQFNSRKRGLVIGTISKLKKTRALVDVQGVEWDVPMAMLKSI